MQANKMSRIKSSVPGRIRLRNNSLRDPGKLNELQNKLSKISVICSIQSNIRTGSLLLHFDRKTSLANIEVDIDSVVEQIIGKVPKPTMLLSKRNLNRYNKMAMLGNLGTSLLALGIKRRKPRLRWHTLTGYLFIANLGAHLFFYRKALRRTFR
ncbi:MAG: hypothetical protein methR_P3067 [Methyloprofundus sp.]|nr:MAG: hypothetical protein methR_P3067 [Methyloprofundus sp.]